LPDAESITEYFGEFEARGLRFEVVPAPQMGGYALRMQFGPGSNAAPVFPLPAVEMQTADAAAEWMQYLREKYVSQFDYLLQKPLAEESQ